MSDRNRRHLIIFVKNRTVGNVKTRLAATVGNEKALRVYNRLLELTSQATENIDAAKIVSYSIHLETGDQFDESNYQKTVQSGGDLGDRMKNAFEQSFSSGCKEVVLIGSDCPDISESVIKKGFRELKRCDCVIGPAEDGGYYLIGLSRCIPQLFEKMEWSVSSLLDETIKRLNGLSDSYTLLPVLNDIDDEEDLKRSRLKL
ncbi:TIGR04282 family arsenosugar biosynthesis glycosyltransferase [Rhodohalobacter halophilus]|uniref:TIGR04282 family arsenosugar biosynthesis glycosyltransferase n=1 Tax=Rhodohalobacter halophilus TaxID=1812810 RepID=UPI00083F8286|nr:TIGR04282 family arsenosugar biosynthesis glycosyltransferase [Rhodohalobacter halophilus]